MAGLMSTLCKVKFSGAKHISTDTLQSYFDRDTQPMVLLDVRKKEEVTSLYVSSLKQDTLTANDAHHKSKKKSISAFHSPRTYNCTLRCSSFLTYDELHRPSFDSCFNEDMLYSEIVSAIKPNSRFLHSMKSRTSKVLSGLVKKVPMLTLTKLFKMSQKVQTNHVSLLCATAR
jgi:hypothetical protein